MEQADFFRDARREIPPLLAQLDPAPTAEWIARETDRILEQFDSRPSPDLPSADMKCGDIVRLTEPWGGLESDADGQIIGFYRLAEGDEVTVGFGVTVLVVPCSLLARKESGQTRNRPHGS